MSKGRSDSGHLELRKKARRKEVLEKQLSMSNNNQSKRDGNKHQNRKLFVKSLRSWRENKRHARNTNMGNKWQYNKRIGSALPKSTDRYKGKKPNYMKTAQESSRTVMQRKKGQMV